MPVRKKTGWWEGVRKEFRVDKHLIPIKIVIFFFNGGESSQYNILLLMF